MFVVNICMKNTISTTNYVLQTINNTNPLHQIKEQEFDDMLLKFGSLISILKNKRINQTMFMVELLNSQQLIDSLKLLTGLDETTMLIYNILTRFPILCKSKIIKNKIKYINDRRRNKKLV